MTGTETVEALWAEVCKDRPNQTPTKELWDALLILADALEEFEGVDGSALRWASKFQARPFLPKFPDEGGKTYRWRWAYEEYTSGSKERETKWCFIPEDIYEEAKKDSHNIRPPKNRSGHPEFSSMREAWEALIRAWEKAPQPIPQN